MVPVFPDPGRVSDPGITSGRQSDVSLMTEINLHRLHHQTMQAREPALQIQSTHDAMKDNEDPHRPVSAAGYLEAAPASPPILPKRSKSAMDDYMEQSTVDVNSSGSLQGPSPPPRSSKAMSPGRRKKARAPPPPPVPERYTPDDSDNPYRHEPEQERMVAIQLAESPGPRRRFSSLSPMAEVTPGLPAQYSLEQGYTVESPETPDWGEKLTETYEPRSARASDTMNTAASPEVIPDVPSREPSLVFVEVDTTQRTSVTEGVLETDLDTYGLEGAACELAPSYEGNLTEDEAFQTQNLSLTTTDSETENQDRRDSLYIGEVNSRPNSGDGMSSGSDSMPRYSLDPMTLNPVITSSQDDLDGKGSTQWNSGHQDVPVVRPESLGYVSDMSRSPENFLEERYAALGDAGHRRGTEVTPTVSHTDMTPEYWKSRDAAAICDSVTPIGDNVTIPPPSPLTQVPRGEPDTRHTADLSGRVMETNLDLMEEQDTTLHYRSPTKSPGSLRSPPQPDSPEYKLERYVEKESKKSPISAYQDTSPEGLPQGVVGRLVIRQPLAQDDDSVKRSESIRVQAPSRQIATSAPDTMAGAELARFQRSQHQKEPYVPLGHSADGYLADRSSSSSPNQVEMKSMMLWKQKESVSSPPRSGSTTSDDPDTVLENSRPNSLPLTPTMDGAQSPLPTSHSRELKKSADSLLFEMDDLEQAGVSVKEASTRYTVSDSDDDVFKTTALENKSEKTTSKHSSSESVGTPDHDVTSRPTPSPRFTAASGKSGSFTMSQPPDPKLPPDSKESSPTSEPGSFEGSSPDDDSHDLELQRKKSVRELLSRFESSDSGSSGAEASATLPRMKKSSQGVMSKSASYTQESEDKGTGEGFLTGFASFTRGHLKTTPPGKPSSPDTQEDFTKPLAVSVPGDQSSSKVVADHSPSECINQTDTATSTSPGIRGLRKMFEQQKEAREEPSGSESKGTNSAALPSSKAEEAAPKADTAVRKSTGDQDRLKVSPNAGQYRLMVSTSPPGTIRNNRAPAPPPSVPAGNDSDSPSDPMEEYRRALAERRKRLQHLNSGEETFAVDVFSPKNSSARSPEVEKKESPYTQSELAYLPRIGQAAKDSKPARVWKPVGDMLTHSKTDQASKMTKREENGNAYRPRLSDSDKGPYQKPLSSQITSSTNEIKVKQLDTYSSLGMAMSGSVTDPVTSDTANVRDVPPPSKPVKRTPSLSERKKLFERVGSESPRMSGKPLTGVEGDGHSDKTDRQEIGSWSRTQSGPIQGDMAPRTSFRTGVGLSAHSPPQPQPKPSRELGSNDSSALQISPEPRKTTHLEDDDEEETLLEKLKRFESLGKRQPSKSDELSMHRGKNEKQSKDSIDSFEEKLKQFKSNKTVVVEEGPGTLPHAANIMSSSAKFESSDLDMPSGLSKASTLPRGRSRHMASDTGESEDSEDLALSVRDRLQKFERQSSDSYSGSSHSSAMSGSSHIAPWAMDSQTVNVGTVGQGIQTRRSLPFGGATPSQSDTTSPANGEKKLSPSRTSLQTGAWNSLL